MVPFWLQNLTFAQQNLSDATLAGTFSPAHLAAV
jgi:hypothetical protein